jgi:hypothetical protein
MKSAEQGMRVLLRVASGLVILGLLTEIASLFWFRPLSFELFVFVSVPLIGLGMVAFLVWFGFSIHAGRHTTVPRSMGDRD